MQPLSCLEAWKKRSEELWQESRHPPREGMGTNFQSLSHRKMFALHHFLNLALAVGSEEKCCWVGGQKKSRWHQQPCSQSPVHISDVPSCYFTFLFSPWGLPWTPLNQLPRFGGHLELFSRPKSHPGSIAIVSEVPPINSP